MTIFSATSSAFSDLKNILRGLAKIGARLLYLISCSLSCIPLSSSTAFSGTASSTGIALNLGF